jgi:cytoskeleton protein RodZ
MTDDNIQQTQTTDRAKRIQLGARLRSVREAMNLSEKDAAARLHLNIKFITMMENEAFDNGLPSTFMRGYLRSYAKLLNIREEDINAELQQLEIEYKPVIPVTPEVNMRVVSEKQTERYVRWVTYPVVFVMLALVGMWWNSHSRNEAPTAAPLQAAVEATPNEAPTPAPTPEQIAAPTAPTPATVATQTTETPATPTMSDLDPLAPAAAPTPVAPTPDVAAAPTAPTITPTTTPPPVTAAQNTPPTPNAQTAAPQPPTPGGLAVPPQTAAPIASSESTDPSNNPPKSKADLSQMKMSIPEPGLPGDEGDYPNY